MSHLDGIRHAALNRSRGVHGEALGAALVGSIPVAAAAMLLPGQAGAGTALGIYTALAGGAVLFATLARRQEFPLRFGAASRITLARAGIAALLAGGLADAAALGPAQWWWVAAAAAAALLLDGVDGWVARRTRQVSHFGARFDMETDAFLILVLALLLWRSGKVGAWVAAIGAMRYLFVAAGLIWPALRRPLPESRRRRVVCVFQGVALLVALTPAVESGAAALLAITALAALAASFATDVARLLRDA